MARTRAARPLPDGVAGRGRPTRRRGAGPSSAARRPTWVLVTLLAVTLALRFGLNAFDSNVIDVGYAGVIGADRITHGATPYGTMPSDCGNCDTYGPLNYISLRPLRAHPAVARRVGRRCRPPTAPPPSSTSSASAGMFALGWRIVGAAPGHRRWRSPGRRSRSRPSRWRRNANDSLVAAMLIWGLVLARHPLRARG